MSDTITIQDVMKIEIRVGQVISAEAPEWSHKLLQFTVNFGPEIGERTIFSGIKQHYQPEELLNKKGIFVVNLEPKKMGNAESQGMMMMSDLEEKPLPIFIDDSVPVGTIIH